MRHSGQENVEGFDGTLKWYWVPVRQSGGAEGSACELACDAACDRGSHCEGSHSGTICPRLTTRLWSGRHSSSRNHTDRDEHADFDAVART